jgi:hypothetical protein
MGCIIRANSVEIELGNNYLFDLHYLSLLFLSAPLLVLLLLLLLLLMLLLL